MTSAFKDQINFGVLWAWKNKQPFCSFCALALNLLWARLSHSWFHLKCALTLKQISIKLVFVCYFNILGSHKTIIQIRILKRNTKLISLCTPSEVMTSASPTRGDNMLRTSRCFWLFNTFFWQQNLSNLLNSCLPCFDCTYTGVAIDCSTECWLSVHKLYITDAVVRDHFSVWFWTSKLIKDDLYQSIQKTEYFLISWKDFSEIKKRISEKLIGF
jgi:hypothetical protein